MLPFAEHKCGESMLKCIDCDSKICPKCMVQCPVGFRCPKCTTRFTSHLLKIDIWVLIRGFFGGLVAGLLFSILQVFAPLGGIYMLFFVYFIGAFVGNILFKISGRKLGGKVAASVAFGILAGGVCFYLIWTTALGALIGQMGQANNANQSMQQQIASSEQDSNSQASREPNAQNAQNTGQVAKATAKSIGKGNPLLYAGLLAAPPISIALIIFLLGAISPFMGWNFSWPGFRR